MDSTKINKLVFEEIGQKFLPYGVFRRCGASKWQRCRYMFCSFFAYSFGPSQSPCTTAAPISPVVLEQPRHCGQESVGRLINNSLENKTRLRHLFRWRFNNDLRIFACLCSLFVLSTAAYIKLANLQTSILSRMTHCCYGYHAASFGSESCSTHTWNDNLRDSLPHLNPVVTPETCSVYMTIERCLERYYTGSHKNPIVCFLKNLLTSKK